MKTEVSTDTTKALISPAAAPDPFKGLTAADRAHVMSAGTLLRFPAGQQIFAQGESHDGIMIVVSGEVRSYYIAPSGREITFAYWGANHFVGGPEVLGSGLHTWSGEAVVSSELLFFPSRELRQLVLQIPAFAINLIEAVTFKSKCFSALLQLVGTRPVTALIARLLLALGERGPARAGIYLEPRYTQEVLAKMVGATRQWVASTLKKMRQEGLIEIDGGQIVLIDLRRLERLAGNKDDHSHFN